MVAFRDLFDGFDLELFGVAFAADGVLLNCVF